MAYSIDRELTVWQPEGETKAVIQVIHGMAEYIGRYARLAADLNRQGIAVAGISLRGHGPNAETLGWFAEKDGWDTLIADQLEVTRRLRARFPGVPLVLLGHSMGSFLAREYAINYSSAIDALVLSGTGHYPLPLCSSGFLLASLSKKKKPAEFVNGIAFKGNNKPFKPARTDFDWLTRDERHVDSYIADPLCGFTFTGSAFHDFFGGLMRLCKTSRLNTVRKDLPVLLLSGDRDPVGQMGKGVETTAEDYRKAGLGDITVRIYKDGRHEMFNETNRDEAIAELVKAVLARA